MNISFETKFRGLADIQKDNIMKWHSCYTNIVHTVDILVGINVYVVAV